MKELTLLQLIYSPRSAARFAASFTLMEASAAALVQVPPRGVHSMRSAIEMASVAVRRVVGVWDTNCYWRHCLRCGCPSEASAVTLGVAAGDARRAHIAAVGNGRPSVSLRRGGCTDDTECARPPRRLPSTRSARCARGPWAAEWPPASPPSMQVPCSGEHVLE